MSAPPPVPASKSGLVPRISTQAGFIRALVAFLMLAIMSPPILYANDSAMKAASPSANIGKAIYRHGATSIGAPLEAQREAGARLRGADAACVNCHRRSGFGAREGRISIPPITGRFLMQSDPSAIRDDPLPYVESMRINHVPAYTDATLARAIREGVDAQGKPLNYLMPRFDLNDSDMASLIAYLKQLDRRKVRGVTDTVLHFATIITPDADPVKRQGMLAVIEQYFADKNATPLGPTARLRTSRKMMFTVNRRWQLHVWELSGAPDTWQEQLKQRLAKEPVLAVVSGLGGKNWAPVHAFCEQNALPCLFPNVEVPPLDADRAFYSLYFSKGVLLESGLIANRILKSASGKTAKTVQQIYRAGDSGEPAAKALAETLERQGIAVRNQVLARGATGRGVPEALAKASNADALVLWLRQPDLAALNDALPATTTAVYMSGLMGGLERSPLPPGWRGRTRLAYPFDLPEQRRVGVDFAFGWFSIRRIPLVAEQVQADTYLACGLLAETLSHMADTFVPDYLIERIEDTLDHRIVTGYYPHLALGAGQRFASKGGYIVQFADAQGQRLVVDSNWFVP